MRAALTRWCAWTAGLASASDWHRWAEAPEPLTAVGVPDLSFLPSLQRRRFDPLARLMVHVARECAQQDVDMLPTVFASRHGPIDTTVGLLADLAAATPISPTKFSHSVHNTQQGLFSIWAANRAASSSVSARSETFVSGFVEALALAQRARADRVLLVVGDIPLPAPLDVTSGERHGGYALALLLEPHRRAPVASLSLAGDGATAIASIPWPPALEFLRWWIRGEPVLLMEGNDRTWQWSRDDIG